MMTHGIRMRERGVCVRECFQALQFYATVLFSSGLERIGKQACNADVEMDGFLFDVVFVPRRGGLFLVTLYCSTTSQLG